MHGSPPQPTPAAPGAPAAGLAGDERPDEAEEVLPRRAAWAVSVAPVLMLVALTLVIGGLLEPETGLAGVLAAVAWLAFEMHCWQQAAVREEARHAAARGFDVLY